jgi:hypothetical protein
VEINNLAIIGCTKTKYACTMPAADLYSKSVLFKKALAYCRDRYDLILIASAKHGIITCDKILEPYNLSLYDISKTDVVAWGQECAKQIQAIRPNTVTFFTGKIYLKYITPYLSDVKIYTPLEGMGMGDRLKFFS